MKWIHRHASSLRLIVLCWIAAIAAYPTGELSYRSIKWQEVSSAIVVCQVLLRFRTSFVCKQTFYMLVARFENYKSRLN